MVKGFDTSTTDVTKIFLDYLLSVFQTDPPLSIKTAEHHFRNFLSDQKTMTSNIYKKFTAINYKPKIVLRKKCKKSLFELIPQNGDNYYPAFQNGEKDQIIVCLENIRNKIELKQNIDRQLVIAYELNKDRQKQMAKDEVIPENKDSKVQDKRLMRSLYAGCLEGYRNYLLPENQTRKMAKKCASYLFRRRVKSDLPHDSLFRYAGKLADQICL